MLLENISTGLEVFWDDFQHKKNLGETWTHPPTSIVNSEFWKKNYFAKPFNYSLLYFQGDAPERLPLLALLCIPRVTPRSASSPGPMTSPCSCGTPPLSYSLLYLQGDAPERLVSGSDDFTLFLWHPAP